MMKEIQKESEKKCRGEGEYTLKYLVNGKPIPVEIYEKDFLKANEKALGILKKEKRLLGKFTKEMNIKLVNNKTNDVYCLKWEKNPPLSGVGGYFTTFETKLTNDEKNKMDKPRTRFWNKYGVSLGMIVVAIIILIGSFALKIDSKENKYIWFLLTLMYGALVPIAKAECMKDVKREWDIIWYNAILDSPLWLGAFITYNGFYKDKVFQESVCLNILAALMVVCFFVLRFGLNFRFEKEKYYKENSPSSNKKK